MNSSPEFTRMLVPGLRDSEAGHWQSRSPLFTACLKWAIVLCHRNPSLPAMPRRVAWALRKGYGFTDNRDDE